MTMEQQPRRMDSDCDGINDGDEVQWGSSASDPTNPNDPVEGR